MVKASLLEGVTYNESKPKIDVLFETEQTKEIRIALNKNQRMKEHKTPFPIVVEVVTGKIDFGVNNEKHQMGAGDLISLEGSVPHDVHAIEPTIIRLSLSKSDSVERIRSM
ncbi:MAG: cupin [Crocinitomicaceae bacterium]|nr:cupin [Crocinitomicaceae bacterium]